MGGQTVTTQGNNIVDITTGKINIEKVTGDIEITATAKKLEIQISEAYVNTTQNATSYQGKTITTTKEVIIDQYKSAGMLVQYDAGEWTEEEINSLKTNSLYNINTAKAASDTTGLDFTFGGFTYKGDSTNKSHINNGTVITNRNQSVAPQSGMGTPIYEGWQILEVKDSSGNTYSKEDEVEAKLANAKKEKIYVTKLVHAGSPENFVYYYKNSYDAYRAEYILSGGQRQTTYNTYKARDWSMYKDKDQLDLIDEVHVMTYDEALKITGNTSNTTGMRNTRGRYWLASAYLDNNLWFVNRVGGSGYLNRNYCWVVRPVVSLKSGVYIEKGTGTEEDKYILKMEQ